MRRFSSLLTKWKWILICALFFYCLTQYFTRRAKAGYSNKKAEAWSGWLPLKSLSEEDDQWEGEAGFKFTPSRGKPFYVEEVLTSYDIKLKERLTCSANVRAPPKLILSWNAGHSQDNLGGCPDWNCKLTHDHSELSRADAVLIMEQEGEINRSRDPYFVYFSQESPMNSRPSVSNSGYFNMSLGFRHDSPSSSPYGYAVRLSAQSRPTGEVINMTRVAGKTKGAAWFVSHCDTNSKRENYVNMLKSHFPVDVYGMCGNMRCERGGACETMLDDEYHFYIAFENSICKDYITEKLWNQGYGRDIIPIVLKRSVVEQYVPPKSFIAADDFSTTKELAAHLHFLMQNKSAYADYFQWRHEYKVVFLDGRNHDALERPWGFCQLCRLLWERPRRNFRIQNFTQYWDQSCERDGELVEKVILNELANLTTGARPAKSAGTVSNMELT